jgi:hypothetical protein
MKRKTNLWAAAGACDFVVVVVMVVIIAVGDAKIDRWRWR